MSLLSLLFFLVYFPLLPSPQPPNTSSRSCGNHKYRNVDALLADLKLMADNAARSARLR